MYHIGYIFPLISDASCCTFNGHLRRLYSEGFTFGKKEIVIIHFKTQKGTYFFNRTWYNFNFLLHYWNTRNRCSEVIPSFHSFSSRELNSNGIEISIRTSAFRSMSPLASGGCLLQAVVKHVNFVGLIQDWVRMQDSMLYACRIWN